LGVDLAACRIEHFPDGELHVVVLSELRGADVYLIQPTGPPTHENLFELLLLADACHRAGVARTTAVVPYLGYARQRAIADHTDVYVVFVPPNVWQIPTGPLNVADRVALTNLWSGQYTTYALLSLRSVGDQPGVSTARYLTAWRSLPNGVFIDAKKFGTYRVSDGDYVRAFPVGNVTQIPPFPFPSSASSFTVYLPYIGFNYLGQLTSPNNEGEAIPLSRGSIFYATANGVPLAQPADVLETPPGNSTSSMSNVIHLDWVTGRAHVFRQEVQ